jgi:hypothetical protein
LAAAVAIALAVLVKFSALLLFPALVLLYAACWVRRLAEFPLRRALTAAAVVPGVLLLTVVVVYWPETVRCWETAAPPLATVVIRKNAFGNALYWLGSTFHLPAHAFLTGLDAIADHNAVGHESYLLGMHSKTGWWYYFPVVLAVKSTLTALAATLLAIGASVWAAWKRGFRRVTPMTLGLALPPLIFLLICMTSGINIGVRYILPIYPFLYVGVAAILANAARLSTLKRVPYVAMLVLAAGQIAECASIHPDYLAFFNALAGGPARGPEYLVDSNIDWGQDAKKLLHWLEAHGTHRALVHYFGNAPLGYYGIQEIGWPAPLDGKAWDEIDDFCVASVTPLHGVYVPASMLAPLRRHEPIAKIGWSLYVYDLRRTKAGP